MGAVIPFASGLPVNMSSIARGLAGIPALVGFGTPDNVFSVIPGTAVQLSPTLSGLINIGDLASGLLDGLAIPVTAGTRLMLVFYIESSGPSLINSLLAYLGGGVGISRIGLSIPLLEIRAGVPVTYRRACACIKTPCHGPACGGDPMRSIAALRKAVRLRRQTVKERRDVVALLSGTTALHAAL